MINSDKFYEFLGMVLTLASVYMFSIRDMQAGYVFGLVGGMVWAYWGIKGNKAGLSFLILQGFLIAINGGALL